ncbi:hypothetical protein [Terrisporobacter sp.]|uniref:hypothetical protein n=1 Tax=Terrisporobacter sp. TaxID=1965305 RepID=UPI0025FDD765|nr:hypothetical protein [uncultured Terrisporobacter sp.]
MKIKKIGFFMLIIGIFTSASIISNAALDSNEKVSKKEITSLLEEAEEQSNIDNGYLEHITISTEDGYVLDTYVDRENYLEQIDEYENGELVSRKIFYDEGRKLLSIGKDNGEYGAVVMTLDPEIAAENKRLFDEVSQIESYVSDVSKSSRSISFKKKQILDSSIVKYSSKNINLYFDESSNNFLTKQEDLKDGKVYQTTEYEKISKKSKAGKSLFSQTSPLNNNESGSILDDIETIYINQEKDVPLDEAR